MCFTNYSAYAKLLLFLLPDGHFYQFILKGFINNCKDVKRRGVYVKKCKRDEI